MNRRQAGVGCAFAFAVQLAAVGQVPQLIHYQGRLLNGTNLVNGNVGLSLRLFNVPAGGSPLYEDSNTVAVADGLYSTFLGDNTLSGSLAGALTNAQVFIETAVDGTALAPRERLAAVGYAVRASQLDASGASNFVARTGGTMSGPLTNAISITSPRFLSPENAVESPDSIALGGINNAILQGSDAGTIGGGLGQVIGMGSPHATIAGGEGNAIGTNATGGAIGGGSGNAVGNDARFATIPGGSLNSVTGSYGMAAGRQAKANHVGTFVWADSLPVNFASTASNQFLIRAGGGVGIGTNVTTNAMLVVAGHIRATGSVTAAGFTGSGAGLTSLSGGSITPGSISNAALADGAVTGNKLAAGSVTAASLANGAVTAGKIAANAIASSNIINGTLSAADFATVGLMAAPGFIPNPTPATNDQFGGTIAAVGPDRFVIAAPFDDTGPTNNVGCVYLHAADGTLLATVTNPTPQLNDQFGFALAGLGTNAFAVGVPSDSIAASDDGAVYLYNSNGLLQLVVTNPAPAPSDNFGHSVAGVGSNRFVVGAPFDVLGTTNAGAAYLYALNGTLITNIANPSPTSGARFGFAVASAPDGGGGDYFLVTAPRDDTGAGDSGAAHLYDAGGTLVATLANPSPGAGDEFGSSAAGLGNGLFAIGAPFDDAAGANNAGAVHLFDLNGDYSYTITNPAPALNDNFGHWLARVGQDRLLVGAPNDDAGAVNAGAAYLYDANSGIMLAAITNPAPTAGDQFGYAGAGLGQNRLILGVPFKNAAVADEGGAHLYDASTLAAVVPGLVAEGVAPAAITSAMLADGSVTAAKLATGAVTSAGIADGAIAAPDLASNSVTTAALADAAVTAAKIVQYTDTVVVVGIPPTTTITNPAPGVNDEFGHAVAGLGTNRVLIGCRSDDVGTNSAGAVYLYDLGGSLLALITNPAPAISDLFGSSVAGLGTNRFLVGAMNDDAGASDAGSAYLYDLGDSLSDPLVITNPVAGNGDLFGLAVAFVGTNRLVIGAPFFDAGTNGLAGRAYLFNLNGSLVKAITNPAPSTFDEFGIAVAGVGSNQFVIGANGNDAGAINAAGTAYLYDFDGNLQATITNPAPGAFDNFGDSVAGVGSGHLVIGASGDSNGAASAGSAYLYSLGGTSVTLVAAITNPAPAGNGEFGCSVAGIGTNGFVVGARYDDAGATNAGSAFLFDLGGNLLATITNPTPASLDEFGFAVAAVGTDHVVVGARGDDAGTTNAGVACLYSTATNITTNVIVSGQYTPGLYAEGVRSGAIGASQLSASVTPRIAFAYVVATNQFATSYTVSSYNCTQAILGGGYRITFTTPPANDLYVPVVTPIYGGSPCFFMVTNRTLTHFDIEAFTTSGFPVYVGFSAVVFGVP